MAGTHKLQLIVLSMMKTSFRKNSILVLKTQNNKIQRYLPVNVVTQKKRLLKEFGCKTVIMDFAGNVLKNTVERSYKVDLT